MIASMRRAFEELTRHRFIRFAIVGGVSGLIYAVVVMALTMFTAMGAVLASAIGYICAIPVNFAGQRQYAFRSNGALGPQAVRFAAVQGFNIAISMLVMYACTALLGWPTFVGIVLVIMCIPVATYIALKLFVFVTGPVETTN